MTNRLAHRLAIKWSIDRQLMTREYDRENLTTYFYRVDKDNPADRVLRFFDFSGITWGQVIFVRTDRWHSRISPTPPHTTFMLHERRHHEQCVDVGHAAFQAILYGNECVKIYLFQWNKHAYYDNCYEVEARKAAGQDDPDWKDEGLSRWTPWKLK